MRQTRRKTFGLVVAALGLFSSVAMARPAAPGQTLVCTKVDANGYCIEAKAHDDKMVTVRVEGTREWSQRGEGLRLISRWVSS